MVVFSPHTFLIPILGFIFMPWTTLIYLLNYSVTAPGHLTMWGWAWVTLAVLADLGSYGSSRFGRGRRSSLVE
ncbi:hypothetical protein HJC99_03940 [Candidatus Saccharibacteria bacterium]|nr:hypothetical protein [Candidatus Saccharibacteria bacterium]